MVAEIRAAGGEAVANGDDVADWDSAGRLVATALEPSAASTWWSTTPASCATACSSAPPRTSGTPSAGAPEGPLLRGAPRGRLLARQAKAGQPVDARIINTSSGAGLQGQRGQSAYSAAKGGIAALTLVQAAELGRYGVTANAIAPSARTRMTEPSSPNMMKRPDGGFDAMAPENVSPLVVWLGSSESREVTGCVFEVAGGKISVADGWRDGPAVDKGARWEPDEIGAAVHELLAKRTPPQKVYGT